MGRGIYFADDPMKADQYTSSAAGVHYMFVCAIARGCMLPYRRDSAMFSDPDRRVPAAIQGSSDVYDGIKVVADPSRNRLRYNEAALFGHAAGGHPAALPGGVHQGGPGSPGLQRLTPAFFFFPKKKNNPMAPRVVLFGVLATARAHNGVTHKPGESTAVITGNMQFIHSVKETPRARSVIVDHP